MPPHTFSGSSGEIGGSDVTVPLWNRMELVLTSTTSYRHPDVDVRVSAAFAAPDGTTLTVPGFWDGGDTWRVRFAPTMEGEWSYVVSATDAENTGLHDRRGIVQAVAYSGDLDLYKHGFVKVSQDRRGFVFDDGSPFFWLGDTHWQAPNYERLDECNHPDCRCASQFRHAVDEVVAQGFTVYQTYPDAAANDGGGNVSQVSWWTENYTELNPSAFTEQFDPMMDYLADRGLVIALGMGVHWQNGQIGEEAMRRFAAYVTARYSAHPVVWITGQEVDVENDLRTLPVWETVARTIHENDGYRHPLGAHMDSVGDPRTFGSEPWHDWFPTQGGHGTVRSQMHYRSYWEHQPSKPYLETEANYEQLHWSGEIIDTRAVRQSAWKALQCGSFGYTYGAAGVWAMKWDPSTPGWDEYQSTPWYEGIDLPGRRQMKLMKEFYLSLGSWQRLRPAFADSAYGEFGDSERAVLAHDGDRTYVVYLYNETLVSGTLRGLAAKVAYGAEWFDPRTGQHIPIAAPAVTDGGEWEVPPKPSSEDWVLLVARAEAR